MPVAGDSIKRTPNRQGQAPDVGLAKSGASPYRLGTDGRTRIIDHPANVSCGSCG